MNKDTNLVAFGKRLRSIRKEKKLTQAKLAEIVDMSTNFIGMIERGHRNTTIDKMFKIIKALDVTLNKFFENM